MAQKHPTKAHDATVDFDQLWAEAEAIRKRGEEARRRAWLNWMKENQGRARYSAWLVVPCNLSDYGARPLPSGTPYWVSPFIWVDSPDPSGRPLAGAENFLVAQIFNLGAATAAPTKVDFFVFDPSVGLNPADLQAETPLFAATEWVEVQPMKSKIVTCATPWIPTYLNNGHECAFVNCDNHVLDPLLQPFAPWSDRHVGQRNLAVLPAVQQQFHLWAPLGQAAAAIWRFV